MKAALRKPQQVELSPEGEAQNEALLLQLQQAIKASDVVAVRVLLAAGAPANGDRHQPAVISPLTSAINLGNPAICSLLVEHGAVIDYSYHFRVAARLEDTSLFSALVKSEKFWTAAQERDVFGDDFMSICTPENYKVAFDACPDKEAFVHRRLGSGQTPLTVAVQADMREIFDFLVEHGARPDIQALKIAVTDRNDFIEPLLKAGANPNWKISPVGGPLFYTAKFRSPEASTQLVNAGARIDERNDEGDTPLLCNFNQVERAIHLLSLGSSLTEKNTEGENIFFKFISSNFAELPEFLEQVKSHPQFDEMVLSKDRYGNTGLHLAANCGYEDVDPHCFFEYPKLRTLVDDQNSSGTTALMNACMNGKLKMIRALLGAGANLDMVDKSGDTALIHSIKSGRPQSAKLMILAGADLEAVNRTNQNAFDVAIEANREDLYKFFRAKGLSTVNFDARYLTSKTAADALDEPRLIAALRTNDIEFFVSCASDLSHTDDDVKNAIVAAKKMKDKEPFTAYLASQLAQRSFQGVMDRMADPAPEIRKPSRKLRS